MKYFSSIHNDEESIREQYKSQAKKLHPDAGGSKEEFQDLQFEFEQLKKNGWRYTTSYDGKNYKQDFYQEWARSQESALFAMLQLGEWLFGKPNENRNRNKSKRMFEKFYPEFLKQFDDNCPGVWEEFFTEFADTTGHKKKKIEELFKKNMRNFYLEVVS